MFVAASRDHKWEVLEALFRAFYVKHGHIDPRYDEPIIGQQMSNMRCAGTFRKEFEAAFPGLFYVSHRARVGDEGMRAESKARWAKINAESKARWAKAKKWPKYEALFQSFLR